MIDTDAAGAELKKADETKPEKVEPEVMMKQCQLKPSMWKRS